MEESDSRNNTVEISMLDVLEDKVMMSQTVSELAPGREECNPPETLEDSQAVSPPAYSPATCNTGQPSTCPTTQPATCPTAQPTMCPSTQLPTDPKTDTLVQHADSTQTPEPKPEWTVGTPCQAVWSADGRLYTATILSLDGQRCRVRFDGYGNEDEVDLSTLKQPEGQFKGTQEWTAGTPCRARYSVDGLTYPAVVLWVRGQRCRVRFDYYNNEEELDVDSLLSPNELHGPTRSRRGATWRPAFAIGARRSREASDSVERGEIRERGGQGAKVEREERERDGSWKNSRETKQARDRTSSQNREEGERQADEKKPADPPVYPLFSPFPPFPPPPQHSGDGPGLVPPPPSFWAFGGRDPCAGLDQTSHMLMLWYMCGFHTGSYLAQQQLKSSTRD
ncbi:survival motor neuron protein-like isoform X2 [Boleophthalmus pectinirostris]|uniref:survival motor neuron protein-like isoform X2 n=1 Tax=Boleophthalmus pectinirostris TaxID=150288 RepID=UPI00242C78F8|nr:survival motor neuron protein-like isoform X2 [Boleophthalmus pectinirostris]